MPSFSIDLQSTMHSTHLIVFFLAASKIALCLDNDLSVDYVNWYVPHLPIFVRFLLIVRVQPVSPESL